MGLQFIYRFESQVARAKAGGRPIQGTIMSPTRFEAMSKLAQLGLEGVRVTFDLPSSIEASFGLGAQEDFDPREKVRLYESISRRLASGGRLSDALDACQHYLSDHRLIGAASMASIAQKSGIDGWRAMELAGFVARDVTVIKALEKSGSLPKAFADLAQEAQMRYQSERAMQSAMRQPIGMAIFAYFSILGIVGWIAPKTLKFFAQMGDAIKLSDSVQSFYDFVRITQQSPMLWFAVWVAAGLGLVSLYQSPIPGRLIARVPLFRRLIEKREHLQIWSMYGLLYSVGMPPERICRDLQGVCILDETRRALSMMERKLATGQPDVQVVATSGFPNWVVGEYTAAAQADNLAEGLARFVFRLQEDIVQLTEKTSAFAQKASLAFGVAIIFAMFYITIYPTTGALLRSL